MTKEIYTVKVEQTILVSLDFDIVAESQEEACEIAKQGYFEMIDDIYFTYEEEVRDSMFVNDARANAGPMMVEAKVSDGFESVEDFEGGG